MDSKLGLKLVAVVNLNHLRLYEAEVLKITKNLEVIDLALHKEHRHERGSFRLGKLAISAFEPHSNEKDLEILGTAKIICDYLDKKTAEHPEYHELMVIAEPKLLGHLKRKFSKKLKKLVTKEIAKDFCHQEVNVIEKAIFG